MSRLLLKWGKWIFPIAGCMTLFLFMHVMQKVGDFLLPIESVVALAVFWGITAFGYLLRLNILNRIGGLALVVVAIIITVGMLLPKETVGQYPHIMAESVTQDFDTAWKTIYGQNLFKEFSLHQHLIQYAESLSDFDVHRAGQMGLFGLFGVALGICFLFPIDPSNTWKYSRYILLLLLSGGVWSLQMELLQVLSPTREVTFVGFLESLIGTSLGVLLFALGDLVFLHYKKSLNTRRFNVLGVGIDAVNMVDCLQLFEEIIDTRKSGQPPKDPQLLSSNPTLPYMTTAMGVAGIVESRRNQKLQRILNESVLNTPDGMPLVWLGKLFGQRRIERVYGPDLLRDVCAYGADQGWRHFFYGAAPGIVEKLKEVLEEKHPTIEISGIYCPPFRPLTQEEEDDVVERVNSADTDIFWIGISTPKQLYFMDQIRHKLNCRIICPVGYAFDVNAGVEKDAPDWIKYAGLQWLHRGLKQPRLWKRYLPDNPIFILKVMLQVLRIKKFPMFGHDRPMNPVLDAEGYPRFPAGVISLSAMTVEGARDRIANWIETKQKHYVNCCSTDMVVRSYDHPELAKIVMGAGMAVTESRLLVWLARKFGFKAATCVHGRDLMLEFCGGSDEHPYSHFFYGDSDVILKQMRDNLLGRFPALKIVGVHASQNGCMDETEKNELVDMINQAQPDMVWCGLEGPEQHYWAAEFRPRLNCAAIIAVGEAFKFHAGSLRIIPSRTMSQRLQCVFGVSSKPQHIFRRYLIGYPRFLLQTFKQWLFGRGAGKATPEESHQSLNQTAREVIMSRTNVLGIGVSSVNMDTAVARLLDARAKGTTGYVCVTGVHGVIESQRDPVLRGIHNRSFMTVPDGMPIVWVGKEQGFASMGRVYGPELMLRMMEATSSSDGVSIETDGVNGQQPSVQKYSMTHFLFGATEDMLNKLKTNLENRFPGVHIVGTYAPPFRPLNDEEEEELRQKVAGCKPDFFWVGLSTPKQEMFMASHALPASDTWSMEDGVETLKMHPLDAGIMLGVGAAFPIHAGLQKDAPEWIKNMGLQWFHRLCQEPVRLWMRYFDIVPTFLWLATLQLLGIKKYSLEE